MTTTAKPIISSSDFDAARLELLRRRVSAFAFVVGSLLLLLSALFALTLQRAKAVDRVVCLSPAVGGLVMILVGATRLRRRGATMSLRTLIVRTTLLIVAAVVIQIGASRVTALAITQILQSSGLKNVQIGSLVPLMFSMLCVHTAAAIIVPWTFRESARPVLIITGLAAIMAPAAPDPVGARLGGLFMLILMGTPGMLISALRSTRFRALVERRFLIGRYSETQRELEYARRIHEQLFPRPIAVGPLRFDYRYEPMRQIGGDFVDVIRQRDGRALMIVLVDVTGHGIAAALAVNRLQGEVKRVLGRGENSENVSPGDVIRALNEYVNLTLAEQSIFATALVIRISAETRTLTWASAGHPPAFLRRGVGGAIGHADTATIERLDSTGMLLGALSNDDYVLEDASKPFEVGDVLFAYTDGAIECRDSNDVELGIDGLAQIVRESSTFGIASTLDRVADRVTSHRFGPAEDDTLLLAVAAMEDSK